MKTIGNIYFWLTFSFLVPFITYMTYLMSGIFIKEYQEKYQAWDPLTKQLVSIEGWWIETLLGGCIPMFLTFGIQFFLLDTNISEEKKSYAFTILPFIPKLNWLTNKPIIFLLGTSSAFLGIFLFLGIEGDSKFFWGLFIPFFLFLLTFLIRHAATEIANGKGFTSFTYRHCTKIGWFSICMSFFCWFCADILFPALSALDIWMALTS